MAADRKPYHRGCVKCFQCRIALNPRTLNEHQEQLFCNVCYERIFNPSDFTIDNYGGIVTPEDIERFLLHFSFVEIIRHILFLYFQRKGEREAGAGKNEACTRREALPSLRQQNLSRRRHCHTGGGIPSHLRQMHRLHARL